VSQDFDEEGGMQVMANGRCRRTESEWRQILARWGRSGQTGRDFCRSEGIRLSSFQRWHHRLVATPSESDFVTVTAARPSSPAWIVEVTLPNGVNLRFQG
jgi:hypothetical protein